ncbi:AbiV family abortive infection protein [Pedobacter steynii]|uniref:AbiV family abortive infection protein n=1 Tax=Pedobacter steynii TaxID=430522 RepID=A0A1D7QFC0_9SPHI|nr:AbiV family abortive infection protein [Pedobacter steynii]AOM77388.1 hypothetical protein BFS30_09550 [Pedobacter steynii]
MEFATPLPLENQYNSVVTCAEAAEGIHVSLLNAKELLADGQILFDNARYPRAIALAVLAIEEYGKVEKIKELLLSKQKVSSAWREVRSHKSKNYPWLFPLLKQLGLNDKDALLALTAKENNSLKFLDQLKQICFYTEAIKKEDKKGCYWWLPSEITDADLARFYLSNADIIVNDDGIMWTEGALSVYIQHNYLQDGKCFTKDQVLYYQALRDGKHITEDRFTRIIENVKRMQPPTNNVSEGSDNKTL